MKKINLLIVLLLCMAIEAFGAVQKPVIMVVPSKEWCAANRYGERDPETGDFYPNMKRALENEIFRDAVAGIQNVFADKEYPLEDLSGAFDKISERNSRSMVLKGKDGSVPVEDDIEALIREVKADIYLELEITPVNRGAFNQVKYLIKVRDAASNNTLMSKSDVSARSSSAIQRLVSDAVYSFSDEMIDKIQTHFNDINTNGRDVEIICQIGDGCPLTFESEVEYRGDSGELAELIESWVSDNAVNGQYYRGDKSANLLEIKHLRIPTVGKASFGGKPKAISAEDFARDLAKFLRQWGISVSTSPKGIGTVYCIFGGS